MNEKAARCIKREAFCIFSGFWNVTRNARSVTWNLRRNSFLSISQSKYMSVEKDKSLCYNVHKESCEMQREEVMSKLWLWNSAFKVCNEKQCKGLPRLWALSGNVDAD